MKFVFPSNKKAFNLSFSVSTKTKEDIVVLSYDQSKPDTYYTKRALTINGTTPFILRFPTSPIELTLQVYNKKNGMIDNDPSFLVSPIERKQLKAYDVEMSDSTRSFVRFAQEFAENAGVKSLGFHHSPDQQFLINYLPVITDESGKPITTPLRIEHNSGVIEVSQKYFLGFTVPMRLVGLLHEYSHNYLNPLMGRPVTDETAADINALYIYLGLGYSRVEAAKAFLLFFQNNWHSMNEQRYLILKKFIKDFDNGHFTN